MNISSLSFAVHVYSTKFAVPNSGLSWLSYLDNHILFYKKNRLDYIEIFQCYDAELKEKYSDVYEVMSNEKIYER